MGDFERFVARSEEGESGVLDQEGGEAFEGGYCGFVSKLAGRLMRDVPKLALLGLGGFKEAYAYFGGGGGVMRGDARVCGNGFVRASILKFMSEVSMMPYLTSRLAKVLHSRT